MKIAIMTQPLGTNYGGIMQAWALQQVLKRMGHEPVTIDRQPDSRSLAYRGARRVYRILNSAIGKGKSPIVPECTLATITTHPREFIRSHLAMSPMIDSTEKLRAHFAAEGYQAVIVGSDQTWRPIYSPNLYNYFLDFLPNRSIKKLAYASSFGVDHWEFSPQDTKKCANLVRDFDFISVRETSGVTLCEQHLGVTAHAVLDPTLLLTAEDYTALLNKKSSHTESEGGLYTYLLDKTAAKKSIVGKLSEELGLKIFKHQSEESITDWKGGPIEKYLMPPVVDWLSGFKRADFVVTDSFHGMVFSIIFGKPFIVILNPDRGSTRFESLLEQLGLSDRIISDQHPLTHNKSNIAYKKPHSSALTNLRQKSLEILSAHIR